MKWLRTLVLFDKGDVIDTPDWATLHTSYVRAIASIDHPVGSGTLTLREKSKLPKGQWKRNGVGFLRSKFLESMRDSEKWRPEGGVELARDRQQPPIKLYPSLESYREPITSDFGGFDFMTVAPGKTRVAIEWETGNISSSHRSMNKLAIALSNGIIDVGVLIVPSRKLYGHLTDRIGNIGELSGYLSMWEGLKAVVPRGLLAITVVEHDALTTNADFPYLKVGSDGRAKEGRVKTV
jgi:Restriction endonuclease BamHI